MNIAAHQQLLDTVPLVRSHSVEEAYDRIGRVLSTDRLERRGKDGRLWMSPTTRFACAVSLNMLHNDAVMVIDPGERRFVDRRDGRSFRRAKEYIHANLERMLTSMKIARHACVSPRTREALFKRHGEMVRLACTRRCRLQAMHEVLRQARQQGRSINFTDVALTNGFLHMGRFAAQYCEQVDRSPSETPRPH